MTVMLRNKILYSENMLELDANSFILFFHERFADQSIFRYHYNIVWVLLIHSSKCPSGHPILYNFKLNSAGKY